MSQLSDLDQDDFLTVTRIVLLKSDGSRSA